MSRLDSFIRRMTAQRDILNMMVARLDDVPGLILELGLGSGRTLDHLREHFPGRQIVAFENDPHPHVIEQLAPLNLIIGDLRETTRDYTDGCAALIHLDLSVGRDYPDDEARRWLAPLVARLLTPGGYVVSDLALQHPALTKQSLPATIPPDRYHLSQRRS